MPHTPEKKHAKRKDDTKKNLYDECIGLIGAVQQIDIRAANNHVTEFDKQIETHENRHVFGQRR